MELSQVCKMFQGNNLRVVNGVTHILDKGRACGQLYEVGDSGIKKGSIVFNVRMSRKFLHK